MCSSSISKTDLIALICTTVLLLLFLLQNTSETEFWRGVPGTGVIPKGPYKESAVAGIRFANIAAYGLLLDKYEAKEDNTLQRDCGVPPRFSVLGWCTHSSSFCECWLLVFHRWKIVWGWGKLLALKAMEWLIWECTLFCFKNGDLQGMDFALTVPL